MFNAGDRVKVICERGCCIDIWNGKVGIVEVVVDHNTYVRFDDGLYSSFMNRSIELVKKHKVEPLPLPG